jgi:hypothetical protein
MSVALIYIARGAGAGLRSAQDFFAHYEAFPAGCAHRLIVAVKGWDGVPGLDDVRSLAASHGGEIVDLPDDGLDWGVYIRLAPDIREEWVCVLNSFSRPRVEGWLRLLEAGVREPGVGAAGATGSWESNLSSGLYFRWSVKSLLQYPLRLAYAGYRHLRYGKLFPRYPNPHLRSNAFLIRTALFAEYCAQQRVPATKLDALLLECGETSITRFLLDKGLDVRVIGADGRSFGPAEWNRSNTFRAPGQNNLLIHDNRTRLYETHDAALKKAVERATWGTSLTP